MHHLRFSVGSKRPIFGTSPIAIGFPNPSGENHLLDMAPSVAARGKIRKAMRAGERIPEGWALDAEGRHTIDPSEAIKGWSSNRWFKRLWNRNGPRYFFRSNNERVFPVPSVISEGIRQTPKC